MHGTSPLFQQFSVSLQLLQNKKVFLTGKYIIFIVKGILLLHRKDKMFL